MLGMEHRGFNMVRQQTDKIFWALRYREYWIMALILVLNHRLMIKSASNEDRYQRQKDEIRPVRLSSATPNALPIRHPGSSKHMLCFGPFLVIIDCTAPREP
jgi:hypothetical protein